ncbi:MAG: hypothetical protein Kow00123_18450 [Anaerolineales bacterium]
MDVVNWLCMRPDDSDLKRAAEGLETPTHLRKLLQALVRAILAAHPWRGRTDLVPVFDPSRRYEVGSWVALPVRDAQGLRPDTWRVARVADVADVQNPAQGKFQVVTLQVDGGMRLFAAGVAGARALPFSFPPADEQGMEWLVANLADAYAEPLAEVVRRACDEGRLPLRIVDNQVIRLDTQPTFGDEEARAVAEAFAAAAGRAVPYLTTGEILAALRTRGCWRDVPEDLATAALTEQLPQRNYCPVGGDRWMRANDLAGAKREVIFRPKVPVIRSRLLQEMGVDDTADFDDYDKVPLSDRKMEAALAELGESRGEKPPTGPWRPPARAIAVGPVTYQHIGQGFLALGALADAFPPEPDPLLVDVTLVEGDPIPCWVSRQEGMLKAADAEQWRRRFLYSGIPAGTKLWLGYKGGTSYRIAPRPLRQPRRVRCKLAWMEGGKLQVAEEDIEIRYESDPHVFKAELRFEDIEALFREAEECGYSIFDVIYQEFQRLAALHPEGKVHQSDLFNAVFLRRMCSPRSVVTELYSRPCFVPAGKGCFVLDEAQGFQRRYGKKPRGTRLKPDTPAAPIVSAPKPSPGVEAEAPSEPQPEPAAVAEAEAPSEPEPAPVAAVEAEAPPTTEAAAEAEAPPEPQPAPAAVAEAPSQPEPAPAAVVEAPSEPEPAPAPAQAHPPAQPEDIWRRAAQLDGRELRTPREGQPFRVSRVTDDALHIALPDGRERRLERAAVERAWRHLAQYENITKGEIRRFCAEQDACYLGPILAALAGGDLVVQRDCSLTPAPLAETPAAPPERTRKGQLVMTDVVPAGPLFEPPAEDKPARPAAQAEHDLPRAEGMESPVQAPTRASAVRAARPTVGKRDEMQAKTLFSNHYLETRLSGMPEWAEDPRPVFDAVRALWQKARQHGGSWNEAQTEDEFVKPVLDLLGWAYIPQAKSLKAGKTSRPDYALFRDAATRDEAYAYQGQDDAFYSRVAAIAEAKYWERPLSQKDSERRETWKVGNPSHQMVSYLVGTRAPWGILTNGRVWRLYSREVSSTASEFYEVDLADIFDALPPDAEPYAAALDAFRRWWLFFRRDAFVPDAQNKSFVQRVHEGSATYARQVSDKLKDLVFQQVVPEIAGGFIAYRYHQKHIRQETDATLREIYAATLSLLYKLLFLLYAEARNLLPINDPAYREQSLTALGEWAAECLDRRQAISDATHATPRYDALLALFRRIDQGDPSLGIPRYNGGLFSPKSLENWFLEEHRLSDRVVAHAIDTLRRDAGQPVDYAYISVRNLGAIYEGLLENKLRVVNAERGQVELVNDKGERKATGSYYTPDYIVEYIVRHTLDPILDERGAAFRDAMDRIAQVRGKLATTADAKANELLHQQLAEAETEAREAFLGIKVLDPAMGSGHFLVNAVDHLTDGIIQRMQAYHTERGDKVPWEWNPIQKLIDKVRADILKEMAEQGISVDARRLDDTAILTRIVMKRCIYGVDLNPLAVELAKLSLWLHSFTVGAPLSFLDHHLRWGNSLIGTDVRTVQREIHVKRKGEAQQYSLFAGPFAGLLDLTGMMVEVAERADATLADVRQSAEIFDEFQKALTPYKQVLDLWVSQYFGNKAAGDFLTLYGDDVLPALRGERQVDAQYRQAIDRARELWRDKRFFHWDLEFPEAFVDLRKRDWAENPGFDAVIGNPPYGASLPAEDRTWMSRTYGTYQGRYDSYKFFMERGIRLTRRGGYYGEIVPNTWTYVSTYAPARRWLFSAAEIINFTQPHAEVFKGEAIVETTIPVFRCGYPTTPETVIQVRVLAFHQTDEDFIQGNWIREGQVAFREFADAETLSLQTTLVESHREMVTKIESMSVRLGDIAVSTCGLQAYHHSKHTREQIEKQCYHATRPLNETYVRQLLGRDIGRYQLHWNGEMWLSYGDWLYAPMQPECFNGPRLLTQQISKGMLSRVNAVYTDEKYVFNASITVTWRRPNSLYSLAYVLSILNSGLMSWYYPQRLSPKHVKPSDLDRIPIRRISFTTPAERRAALGNDVKRLYEAYLASGDPAPVLDFVSARLAAQPEESDVVHDLLAHLAQQMIDLNKQKQAEMKGFLAWLEREIGARVDDLTGKSTLRNYLGDYQKDEVPLTVEDLLDILRKNRRRIKADPSARAFQEALKREYEGSLGKLLPVKARLAATDRLIDLVVYRLYGLTEDEIAIVEGRAT